VSEINPAVAKFNPDRCCVLVLAAGFGTRLKPLTDFLPKPFVPFLTSSPVAIAIRQFKARGLKNIAVNLHAHSAVALRHLQKFPDVVTSIEEPLILGTGGALAKLRDWVGERNLIVYNGDIVSDIEPIFAVDLAAEATMTVLPHVIPGESPVHLSPIHADAGTICGIAAHGKSSSERGNFACMQYLTPKFLRRLPSDGAFDVISKGYAPVLESGGRLAYRVHRGYWSDIGRPAMYLGEQLKLVEEWSNLSPLLSVALADPNWKLEGSVLRHVTAKIDPTAQVIGPGVVGESCVIGAGARVVSCVLHLGARVEDKQQAKNQIRVGSTTIQID
jgi:mannose-1-phosphate guanylyltransferase